MVRDCLVFPYSFVVKVNVLLLYSAARPDGFSSALQPYPWQGTRPTLV